MPGRTLVFPTVGTDPVTTALPRGQSALLWASLLRCLAETAESGPDRAPRVLDCGGGSGSLAVPLAGQGAEVTVVDVSIDALSTLIRRAAEAGASDRVAAVQGDAEALSELVPSGYFDLVLAHEVLENLTSLGGGLQQITAVLRPGGSTSVVVSNPVAVVLGRALAGDVTGALTALRRPTHQIYDLESLVRQCRAVGLEVDSVDGIGVFSELVPGIELERPGNMTALAELENATAAVAPYRDIASRLHIMARRPETA
jgi:S-adenosylmethionine-dependent methyltransferase